MTRRELLAALTADHPHLQPAKIAQIIRTIFDGIADALARGQRVELRGFGNFSVRRRDARTGA
jgi:integration host factor subunit beta